MPATNPNLRNQSTVPRPNNLELRRGNPRNGGDGDPTVSPDWAPSVESALPPEHMSEIAKELWPDLVGALKEAGLLSVLDLIALEMLCEAYSDWCQARQALADNFDSKGQPSRYYEIIDKQGNTIIKPHPALAVLSDADRRVRAWLQEFGMTPSARAANKIARELVDAAMVRNQINEELNLDQLDPEERTALREMLERRAAQERAADRFAHIERDD